MEPDHLPDHPPTASADASDAEPTGTPLPPHLPGTEALDTAPDAELAAVFVEAETLFGGFKQQCTDFQQARQELVERKAERYSQPDQQQKLREKFVALELELFETFLSSLSVLAHQKLEILGQQENFWQFVRYAGLGFGLGILAKSLLR